MAGPLCFSNQSPLYGRGQQTQPTDIKVPYLAKATIAQQAANRRGTTGGICPSQRKMKARCRWRCKLGAADSGERAGRGRC
jgi:hypothetical protein